MGEVHRFHSGENGRLDDLLPGEREQVEALLFTAHGQVPKRYELAAGSGVFGE
jgi:hypothetical protein